MNKKMNKIENITLGCDPEFFLKNINTEEFVSAVGLIGGTKEKPTDISPKGLTGYGVQEDNVAVEFNIPPAKTAEEMIGSISYVMDWLKKNKLPGTLRADPSPSAEFNPKYLKSKQAQTFGCEPDINAWECCENISPSANGNWRCAGGHIHIGYNNPNLDTSLQIIKAMDLFLGVPSVLYDQDKERKKMYGKAGACRFKNFGTEYRVLSNFWIFNDVLIEWAFNNTLCAIKFINDNKNFDKLIEKESELIINTINSQNKEEAEKLIKKYKIPVPDFNKGLRYKSVNADRFYKAMVMENEENFAAADQGINIDEDRNRIRFVDVRQFEEVPQNIIPDEVGEPVNDVQDLPAWDREIMQAMEIQQRDLLPQRREIRIRGRNIGFRPV